MRIKKNWWTRLKRAVRFNYLQIMRTKASSHTIAMGLACGVFGGCFPAIPPLPLQTVIAIALAFILRGSKVPAILATWVSNPLNWVFFYIAQYKIGTFFIPLDKDFNPMNWDLSDYLDFGWQGLTVMLLGAFVLAIPCAVGTYFATRPLIRSYRRKRALRQLHKRTSL